MSSSLQRIVAHKRRMNALREAWNNAGPMPAYHNRKKQQLKDEWPVLYNAISDLLSHE